MQIEAVYSKFEPKGGGGGGEKSKRLTRDGGGGEGGGVRGGGKREGDSKVERGSDTFLVEWGSGAKVVVMLDEGRCGRVRQRP